MTCKFKSTSPDEKSYILSTTLKQVFYWINVVKLKVNTSKCNFISFSYRKILSLPPTSIDSGYINETDSIKILCILIDKIFTFNSHINTVFSKLSKTVGLFSRLKLFLPPEIIKKNLYHSLVHPYPIYNIESWYGTSLVSTSRASVLQKKSYVPFTIYPITNIKMILSKLAIY